MGVAFVTRGVAVVSEIWVSPTLAEATSSTVPASPAGTAAVTASWVPTARAASWKAAESPAASVAVTSVPLPAWAKAASCFSWLPLPIETASSTTPERPRARRACAAVALLPSSSPSESSTMLRLPSRPRTATPLTTASFRAVEPSAVIRLTAETTALRSVVGFTATSAASAKLIRPTLTSAGTEDRYCRAAALASLIRSSCFMLPLASRASMTCRSPGLAAAFRGAAVDVTGSPARVTVTLPGSMDSPSARPCADRMNVTSPSAERTSWMRPSGAAQATAGPTATAHAPSRTAAPSERGRRERVIAYLPSNANTEVSTWTPLWASFVRSFGRRPVLTRRPLARPSASNPAL